MQCQLQSVKKKCEESGCTLTGTTKHEEDEEEDFWEECTFESVENGRSSALNKCNDNVVMASTSRKANDGAPERSKGKAKSDGSLSRKQGETASSSTRNKFLDEAPVVKWGSFLDHWGSNRDFMANQRGLDLESHWGRVDPDAVIPAEKIAESNLAATLYEEERAEIRPCHAPLHKGGLCPRRDLKVCPFHGPVIARDDKGNPIPISLNVSTGDTTVDSHLIEQLAKQAVKNVRYRDDEDARKRKLDKKSLKRAKLAKIREHNEAVLKDAAIASTPNTAFLGEDLETVTRGRSSSRNKEESLASMLRKKDTTKDRLTQRLLNHKARDGTVRQLTLSDDAKYREAFPNQW
ncbi:hypothetical protein M5689_004518 [Euphorbia peplus]|nr:hypothetical protein M5689_004518 [Euphorbia peplus]